MVLLPLTPLSQPGGHSCCNWARLAAGDVARVNYCVSLSSSNSVSL